jgi:hypothetical protein
VTRARENNECQSRLCFPIAGFLLTSGGRPHPPQPGLNDGSFLRAPTIRGGSGWRLFEVAAQRNDVGNSRAAIEFEYRNRAIRIQGTERRGELFTVARNLLPEVGGIEVPWGAAVMTSHRTEEHISRAIGRVTFGGRTGNPSAVSLLQTSCRVPFGGRLATLSGHSVRISVPPKPSPAWPVLLLPFIS